MRNELLIVVIAASLLLVAALYLRAQPPPATAHAAPFRVAVVGLVHGHVDGFLRQYLRRPDIQLVGIAEQDQHLAARYASQFNLNKSLLFADLDDMLAKVHPQAVVTYTNTFDHRVVVETCAKHGVHVMMEKPLAVSLTDARAIERTASSGHINVLVNYETTWYRSNRAACELVHTRVLGEIRKIVAHDGHSGPKEIGCGSDFLKWLTDPHLNGGGALFDFGCYGANLATWMLDDQRPTSVTAVTQQIKPDVYPRVDDEATIIVTYPKAQLIIQASWNWPFDRKDIEVYGQRGSVKTVARDHVQTRKPSERVEQQLDAPPIPAPEDDPITYFRAVVMDAIKPTGPSSLKNNMIVIEILDAARESARSGKTIAIPPAGR